MGNARKLRRQGERHANAKRAGVVSGPAPRPWLKYLLGGAMVVVLIIAVVYIASDVSGNPQGVAEAPAGTEYFTIGDAAHTDAPVQYAQTPPAGGPHNPTPLQCRAYDVPVSNENAVHSLEHGAVWITYQPDLDESQIGDLEGFARRRDVLVSPYPGLDSPVVLTTWGTQLRLDSANGDLIDQFIRAFQHRTAPENNVGC